MAAHAGAAERQHQLEAAAYANRFVDQFVDVGCCSDTTWFGRNMLLQWFRRRKRPPMVLMAAAVAVAPPGSSATDVLAGLVADDAPFAYVASAIGELWTAPTETAMPAGPVVHSRGGVPVERLDDLPDGTVSVFKAADMASQYRFFARLARMPRVDWPATAQARAELREESSADAPDDATIFESNVTRAKAAAALAPCLVALRGECAPFVLRRALYGLAEKSALAAATLAVGGDQSALIRVDAKVGGVGSIETDLRSGYLALPWGDEAPSKLSELRAAVESAGLSTRAFVEGCIGMPK